MAPTKTQTSAVSPTGRLLDDDMAQRFFEHARSTRPFAGLLGPMVCIIGSPSMDIIVHPQYNPGGPIATPVAGYALSDETDFADLERRVSRLAMPYRRFVLDAIPEPTEQEPLEKDRPKDPFFNTNPEYSFYRPLEGKQKKERNRKNKAERNRKRKARR